MKLEGRAFGRASMDCGPHRGPGVAATKGRIGAATERDAGFDKALATVKPGLVPGMDFSPIAIPSFQQKIGLGHDGHTQSGQ